MPYHLKDFLEAIWRKFLGQYDVRKMLPGCGVLSNMTATMLRFWASLETNFIRKTCTLDAETSVSDYKLNARLTKKYTFFEVTFSFNVKTVSRDNSELEANNFKTNKCRNSVFLN